MSEKVPGIARNRCPLCGELVPVRWWELLPSKPGPIRLRCRACKGRVVVARSTSLMSMGGGIVTGFAGVVLFIHFAGVGNKPALWCVSACGYLVGSTILGKLGLRLKVEGRD